MSYQKGREKSIDFVGALRPAKKKIVPGACCAPVRSLWMVR